MQSNQRFGFIPVQLQLPHQHQHKTFLSNLASRIPRSASNPIRVRIDFVSVRRTVEVVVSSSRRRRILSSVGCCAEHRLDCQPTAEWQLQARNLGPISSMQIANGDAVSGRVSLWTSVRLHSTYNLGDSAIIL
ncbi:hypothetical protein ACLKA6_010971 [Drosophila palustris]